MSETIQVGSLASRPQPPRAEDIELRFSDKAVNELEALKTHYPNGQEEKACILPALWIAQREYGGFLEPNAIAEVAHRLNRSFAEVEGVATFYSMYQTEHRPGTHMLEVCTCLSCHMCGAYRLLDHLKETIGIGPGETTEDGMFTIEEVECLDACDRAPVFQVGDEYHGPVTTESLDELIAKLRQTQESTVVKLADEIVQCHLQDSEKVEVRG